MMRLVILCSWASAAWAQSQPAPEPAPEAEPAPTQPAPEPAQAPGTPAQPQAMPQPAQPQATPKPSQGTSKVADNVKHRDAQTLTEDGTYLPQTFAARIGDQRVSGLVLGGYDTNESQGGVFHGVVEGALFNRVAVRVGYDYLNNNSLSVGVRLGLLRQELNGIDLGLFIQYKQLGFSEPNGEVEMALTASRRWGKFGLFGALVYGQGIQREERDGEVRLSGLYSLRKRYNVGLEARGRFDLGEGSGPRAAGAPPEASFDLLVGPVGSISLGPVALLVEAGFHTLVLDQAGGENVSSGFIALAGAGAAF